MKFYDTCALLNGQENCFKDRTILVSNITLKELENIKTSANKSEEVKYRARKVVRYLRNNRDKYIVCNYNEKETNVKINQFNLPNNNDSKIILTALDVQENILNDITFVTDDLACGLLADGVGLKVEFSEEKQIENYTGYIIKELSDEQLTELYSSKELKLTKELHESMLINQYLICKLNGELVDSFKKTSDGFIRVRQNGITAKGKKVTYTVPYDNIKPKDEFQKCYFDSLYNNQVTFCLGRAGTGKSLLGLSYALSQLATEAVDRIIMMCNPCAVKDSTKLGFYKGTRTEKLLASQPGQFLMSKLGGEEGVLRLIEDDKLMLIPLADCRGMDMTNMNAICYITEGQNLSKDHLRLILQRQGDNQVIIEGDFLEQCDDDNFKGSNSGMNKAIDILKGEDIFGTITLENVYRSYLADLADKVR